MTTKFDAQRNHELTFNGLHAPKRVMAYIEDNEPALFNKIGLCASALVEVFDDYESYCKSRGAYYNPKVEYVIEGLESEFQIHGLVHKLLAFVMMQERVSLQACIGYVIHRLCGEMYHRLIVVSLIIQHMCDAGILLFEAGDGDMHHLTAPTAIPEDLRTECKQMGVNVPNLMYLVASSNDDMGYLGEKKHVVMNHKHNKYINLRHINRLNRVRMRIDRSGGNPQFDQELQYDKHGIRETTVERQERWEDFKQMVQMLKHKLPHVSDRPIYIGHRYDTRGRTYCHSHEFSYQGDTFRKSLVNLHTETTIDGDW